MTKSIVPVSRRQMLKATAAFTLAASPFARAAMSNQRGGTSAVVLGAGIAGLSAAYELMKAGIRVQVLEAASMPGGRMGETWMGPLYGPTGAVGFFRSNRAMFELADELGIKGALSGDDVVGAMSNEHGSYAFGLRFDVSESSRIPGMTDAGLRALPRLGAEINRLYAHSDPSLPWRNASLDNVSVADFVREISGSEAAEPILKYALNPVTVAWCGTDVEKASCVPFFSLFARDGGRYIRPRASIASLPNKLAEHLDIELQSIVTNVSPPRTDGRRQVRYIDESGDTKVLSPDFVVCAIQGTRVKAVIDDLSPAAEAVFRHTNYSKFNQVSYVMREGHAPITVSGEYFIPDHPDTMKRKIEFYLNTPAYGDIPGVVGIGLAKSHIPEWQKTDTTLHEYCFPMAKQFYPALEWAHIEDVVIQAGDYVPYMPVGFCRRAADLMAEQLNRRANLYFVGDSVSSAHVGGACASGRLVARSAIEHWKFDA